jgi:hypothetical protein
VQCYEGLDVAQTAYEWNVARQMVEIRLAEAAHSITDAADRDTPRAQPVFARHADRAAAAAGADAGASPVLLIDELDRADEPFDAFLLEVLAENQITIPELGPMRPMRRRSRIITSNRTREIHDALKRRCLYHWVEFPDVERELEIVRLQGARGLRAAVPAGGGVRAAHAHARSVQGAGRGGDDRLDQRFGCAEHDEAGSGDGARHAGGAAEVPGRHRSDARRWGYGEAARRAEGSGLARLTRRRMLADNIVHFSRILRDTGLAVGPDRVLAGIAAVEAVGLEPARRRARRAERRDARPP